MDFIDGTVCIWLLLLEWSNPAVIEIDGDISRCIDYG